MNVSAGWSINTANIKETHPHSNDSSYRNHATHEISWPSFLSPLMTLLFTKMLLTIFNLCTTVWTVKYTKIIYIWKCKIIGMTDKINIVTNQRFFFFQCIKVNQTIKNYTWCLLCCISPNQESFITPEQLIPKNTQRRHFGKIQHQTFGRREHIHHKVHFTQANIPSTLLQHFESFDPFVVQMFQPLSPFFKQWLRGYRDPQFHSTLSYRFG